MPVILSFHVDTCCCIFPADMVALAEADAICEKWDTKKMAKRDEQAETTLWNNRVYTAPRLLEDPTVFHGTGGHVVSIGVGRWGWGWLVR